MPRARVLPDAARELYAQAEYYEDRGTPATADRWVARTSRTFEFLAHNPTIGPVFPDPRPRLADVRTWRVEGFRAFLVFYRPVEDGIEVLHVLRATRDLDRVL